MARDLRVTAPRKRGSPLPDHCSVSAPSSFGILLVVLSPPGDGSPEQLKGASIRALLPKPDASESYVNAGSKPATSTDGSPPRVRFKLGAPPRRCAALSHGSNFSSRLSSSIVRPGQTGSRRPNRHWCLRV